MIGVLALFAGAGLALVPFALGPALLGIRGRVALLPAGLICAGAVTILIIEALSLVDAFARGPLLLAHLVVALALAGLWVHRGRPSPPDLRGLRGLVAETRAELRGNAAVATMVVAAAVALAVAFVLALAVNPNTGDSMMYHLSRAAHWVQNESITQFVGGTIWQLGYPPNGEAFFAWAMSLSGADRVTPLAQWLAAGGAGACVYLAARLHEFARAPAMFAAALWVTLPIPILEASTTQIDLLAAFFTIALVAFGVRALKTRNMGDLVIAGLAAGLAVGTKGTALMVGVPLVLYFGALTWRLRPPRRLVLGGVASVAVGIAALGAFNYALNLRNTSDLNGHASEHLARGDASLWDNATRYASSLVDLPGVSIPWLDTVVKKIGRAVNDQGDAVFSYGVNSNPDETFSAFGPIGLLLVLVLAPLVVVRRRGGIERRLLALSGLIAIAIFVYVVIWLPAMPRNLIAMVAVLAPLLALLGRRPWTAAVATGLALLVLVPCLLANPYKRVIAGDDQKPFWQQDRLAQQSIARPQFEEVVRNVDRRIGAGAPVGVVGPQGSWDYPFFRSGWERRVERIANEGVLVAEMRRQRLAGVVVSEVPEPPRGLGLPVVQVGSEPPILGSPPRNYYLVLPE